MIKVKKIFVGSLLLFSSMILAVQPANARCFGGGDAFAGPEVGIFPHLPHGFMTACATAYPIVQACQEYAEECPLAQV